MTKAEFIRILENSSIGASSDGRAIVCTARFNPFYFSIPTVKNLAIRCCEVTENEAEKIAKALQWKIKKKLAWQQAEALERSSDGILNASEWGIGDPNEALRDIRFTV